MSAKEFWSATRSEIEWKFEGMFPDRARASLEGLQLSMKELERKASGDGS